MRINRNNYEMFFLLYVDKELSAEEQREVEAFAGANDDLAPELDALMKTRLHSPVHIAFGDRTALYKTAAIHIDATNYEEHFLHYIDNELNAEERAAVENFITTHPQYAQELNILKQTVLPAEQIHFINKQSLYRKEERQRRVIYLKPLRFAIAAALIGVTAMVWWLLPGAKNNNANPVAVAVKQPAAKVQQLPQVKTPVVKQADEVAATQQKNIDAKKLADKTFATNKTGEAKTFTVNNNKSFKKEEISKIAKQYAAQSVIVAQHTDVQPKLTAPTVATEVVAVNNNSIKDEILKPLIETDIEKTKAAEAAYAATEKTKLAQPAVYKELDTDEDDTQTLYVGSLELNKDKVKGFLKKATKLFGKTKTTDTYSKL